MPKRGALSVEEKGTILEKIKEVGSVEFPAEIGDLAADMDRSCDLIKKYYSELETLGMLDQYDPTEVAQAEEVVEEEPQVDEEVQKLKREHMQTIFPTKKGSTVMTRAASEYVDEKNKNQSSKPNSGKYSGNVHQIRPE